MNLGNISGTEWEFSLAWHFLIALVSTTCLEELQMVKMWMGRCKTDVLLALFPILLSQWKILC